MTTRICSNKFGCKGVYFDNTTKRYKVSIIINSRKFYLGSFKELEDAIKCRKDAEKKYLKKEEIK